METKTKKGFTLIELLIVIAIIGILASIVLVSLSSAREKAKISSFKAQVHSMQSAAILTCDDASLDATNVLPPASNSFVGTIGPDFSNQSCGPNGDSTFNFTVDSNGLQAPCTATLEHTGVGFAGC